MCISQLHYDQDVECDNNLALLNVRKRAEIDSWEIAINGSHQIILYQNDAVRIYKGVVLFKWTDWMKHWLKNLFQVIKTLLELFFGRVLRGI